MPVMKNISTKEGQLAFKQRIDDAGVWGFAILFGIQILQILLVILPGEPLEVLAGMCYGAIGGSIFILISVFVTTILVFFLVKKYGKKYIYQAFSKEKIDKIEKSKFFKNPQNIELIMLILFIIPGTPKDLLVYIGGILPIKPLRFILISTFARIPSVISSTIVGSNIAFGNWKMIAIIYGITFVITAIFIYIIRKVDKNKITQDAIDVLK